MKKLILASILFILIIVGLFHHAGGLASASAPAPPEDQTQNHILAETVRIDIRTPNWQEEVVATGEAQTLQHAPLQIAALYRENLPSELSAALINAHGQFEGPLSPHAFLYDLQSADIVFIGEAHWDRRDMQTAFEITRLLAQKRRIALAVERLPLTLQPELAALNTFSGQIREKGMEKLLQSSDYRRVWRENLIDQERTPYSFNSSNKGYPSTDIFEEMMLWAARTQIPIIALDLPLSERTLGHGEDIPYRNEVWKDQIVNFITENQAEDYLIVAIGGVDHLSKGRGSVQAKLRKSLPASQILSIGQRDAHYAAQTSLNVENLAATYQIDDLILKNPQASVIYLSGKTIYPTPPDYWIAVHTVDSWTE